MYICMSIYVRSWECVEAHMFTPFQVLIEILDEGRVLVLFSRCSNLQSYGSIPLL